MGKFIGNAEKCLEEANQKLVYAYFSPELDNFNEKITVDDVLFRVIRELDLLDNGNLEIHVKEDSELNWNANRNQAWRKKAVSFINKWSTQSEFPDHYREFHE